MPDEAEAIGGS